MQPSASASPTVTHPWVARVRTWMEELTELPEDLPDEVRIDLVRTCEELKAAAAGAQAVLTHQLERSQGPDAAVGAQVALARRENPVRGSQAVTLARALCAEMPHTLAALRAGRLSEWRATLIARETACLEPRARAEIDALLAGPEAVEALEALGDRRLIAELRRRVYAMDPAAYVRRAELAASQRMVSLRPAPDAMTWVSSLQPVAQGVALYAELCRKADSARAAGDTRTRGQVMADELVAAVLGRPAGGSEAAGSEGTEPEPSGEAASRAPGVELRLVMTDAALLAGDPEPVHLDGYGMLPAAWGRRLLRDCEGSVWVRRVVTDPLSGGVADIDSRRRLFPARLRALLEVRDRTCRTPWCDAPIRHSDHVVAYSKGGETDLANGQGLCEACNYARQQAGWRAETRAQSQHTVVTTTPTGQSYESQAPPRPGARGSGHDPPRSGAA